MYTDFRLKLRNFIKKYKRWVIIGLIAWAIIIAINYLVKNYDFKEVPSTTYEPYTPIMGGKTDVSKNTEKAITNIIDEYFNYCNNKEYVKAYQLLSTDCRENKFPSLSSFENYVDRLFPGKRVYTIQNYYNTDQNYVYRLRIFEDILETGLTGKDDLAYNTEIITLKVENGKLVLSVNGYVGKEDINSVYEDQYIKITVESKETEYEYETYTVTFSNKTQYLVVLQDHTVASEILLKLNIGSRALKRLSNTSRVLAPRDKQTYKMTFTRYYHETDLPVGLQFASVRILKTYPPKYDENGEIMDKIDEYGVQVDF